MSRIRHQIESLRRVAVLAWSDAGRATKWAMAGVLTLIVTTSALTALAPVVLAMAIDRFNGVATGPDVSPLVLIGIYALVHWMIRILGQLRDLLSARADRRLGRVLGSKVFDHIMRLPLPFHLERKTGAINQAVTSGMQGFQMLMQQLLATVIPLLVELGLVAVVLTRMQQPVILGLLAGTLVCHCILYGRGAVLVARPARDATTAQGEAAAAMTEALINYETVKSFGCEPLVLKRYDQALACAEQGWRRFFNIRAISGCAVGTVFGAFLTAGSLYAGWRTLQGTLSVGDFVLVVSYLFQVIRPAEMIGAAMQQVSQGFAFLEKLFELLAHCPESQDGRALCQHGRGEVRFERVAVAYRADRPVLHEISFEVKAGRTLGIVGMSGAGKSTLVKLLMRLIEPDAGRIFIDNVPIDETALTDLRRGIAVVPQDTVLFNDSIEYNIAVGRPEGTTQDIERAARLAHLHEFVTSLPERYATKVGERGVKLSGGEKQRVAIARAAVKQPRIYVFDEATSSLDSQTEAAILGNLQEISRMSTTLIIAHRLSTVAHADEIIVMESGGIVERGDHASLLARAGKYAALWRAQHPQHRQQVYEAALHDTR